VTEWVYGVTTSGGSGLNSNDLVKEVRYPDPSTGASSSSSKDVLTVNALGQPLTMTDRNGTVHTYSYDVLGRQTADAVTTLGSGVDGTVRRLVTAYNTQGNAYLFTAYDASSGGNIVNQVKRDFNGLGQLTSEWQSHNGAVTGSSPRVQYAYSEMPSGANHSRLTSMTYASGYTVNYNYASGLDANISRLSSLSDASNTLESYSYLGLGSVVKRAHSQPGVDLTYIKLSTESVGDAGDQYTGLDRFGRIVDQRWINSSNTDVDRYQYGYDRDGNRLYKDNKVLASLSEVYTYDSLNQLAAYKLGTLNGTKTDVTGSSSNSQSWDYDAVGNWDSITTNSTTQTRTANKQNEITAVSGATTPTYDNNGNLTTDENSYRFVYDAWNKVVQVKNSSNVVIVTYGRDALHRHVTDTVGSTVTDRFFSSDWQLLETKVGFNTITRNVWSPVYVDGLVLRDRDTDANGTLDERLYALQDANWNTTALVNSNGTVQERYTYTPFGQVTFRDGSGSTLSSSAKDWVFLHQGGERIAAGDYEFRNRVYSPTLGRWLSNDPLGFEAGDQNWYRAIGNNPLNFIDPLGLDSTRAKLINAMAKGDVAEVKSTFEVLKAIAPNLLEDGLGATVEKWLAAQAAKEAAAIAAATIAKQALIKSLTPISKQVVKETGPKARRMLEEMAKKAGHELKSGGEHIKVIDKSGNTVTVIPHTPKGTGTIRSIAQAILDSVR
jgi:RHS repeat-associated protein